MKEEVNYKLYIVIITFVICFIAGFAEAVTISSITFSVESYTLKMFSIKGVPLVTTGLIFLVYSVISKKKSAYIISSLFVILGYGYTFITFINIYRSQINAIKIDVHVGLVLYIVSAVMFLIAIILPSSKKEHKEEIVDDAQRGNAIFTQKILGFKEIPYNSVTILTNNKDNKQIILSYVLNDKKNDIIVPYSEIKDVNYTISTRITEVDPKINDSVAANMMLSSFLFAGNPLLILGANYYLNNNDSGLSTKVTSTFDIKIVILHNNVSNDIILTTVANPKQFINELIGDIKS